MEPTSSTHPGFVRHARYNGSPDLTESSSIATTFSPDSASAVVETSFLSSDSFLVSLADEADDDDDVDADAVTVDADEVEDDDDVDADAVTVDADEVEDDDDVDADAVTVDADEVDVETEDADDDGEEREEEVDHAFLGFVPLVDRMARYVVDTAIVALCSLGSDASSITPFCWSSVRAEKEVSLSSDV
jgi:hypothetical protein